MKIEGVSKKFKEFKLTSWAVDNKTAVYIIAVIITIFGLMKFNSMPKEQFPDIVVPTISVATVYVGNSINPITRSFSTEAKLKTDPAYKPNQTSILKILDYQAKGAVAVPVNVVQTDEKGKYVYVIEKTGDKMVARKKSVSVGEAYGGLIEVKAGLSGGEVIITEGYQTVYDGQAVTTGAAK